MFIKCFIVMTMMVIFFTLGSGLYYLIKDTGQSKRVVSALTWRIGLSLSLFVFLFLAFSFGLITPHGV